MNAVRGRRPQRRGGAWSVSSWLGQNGLAGLLCFATFFFYCLSSFLHLAEFFSEPRREGKEDLEKISKQVANILKA
jgi:hypothetical protein